MATSMGFKETIEVNRASAFLPAGLRPMAEALGITQYVVNSGCVGTAKELVPILEEALRRIIVSPHTYSALAKPEFSATLSQMRAFLLNMLTICERYPDAAVWATPIDEVPPVADNSDGKVVDPPIVVWPPVIVTPGVINEAGLDELATKG